MNIVRYGNYVKAGINRVDRHIHDAASAQRDWCRCSNLAAYSSGSISFTRPQYLQLRGGQLRKAEERGITSGQAALGN